MAARMRRPAARPARIRARPAARDDPLSISEQFQSGAKVQSYNVGIEAISPGSLIEICEGSYWTEECPAVVRVERLSLLSTGRYVVGAVTGTKSETLLRYLSGETDKTVSVHLCQEGCTGELVGERDLHARTVRHLGAEFNELWQSNLTPVADESDELMGLRKKLATVAEQDKQKAEEKDEAGKGKKSEEKKARRGRSETSSTSRRKKKKKRRKIKADGTKKRKDLYSNTGLDPSPEVRAHFRRRAKRLGKRKRTRSSSSSRSKSDDSEQGSAGGSGPHSGGLFGSDLRAAEIAKSLPGALSNAALEEMRDQLISHTGGLYSVDDSELPPLVLQYFRSHLQGRMSAAMGREASTLSYICDLLILARPAEALDVGIQRLKSLTAMADGASSQVAGKLELLPHTGSFLTREETQEAARDAHADLKVRSSTYKGGKGNYKWEPWSGGYNGDAKGKGSGKPKGKSEKGDGKGKDKGKERPTKA